MPGHKTCPKEYVIYIYKFEDGGEQRVCGFFRIGEKRYGAYVPSFGDKTAIEFAVELGHWNLRRHTGEPDRVFDVVVQQAVPDFDDF